MNPARVLLFASLPLVTVACQRAAAPSTVDPGAALTADVSPGPVLRTYKVPDSRVEDVYRALRRTIATGPDNVRSGTVDKLEDGRIVVVAPEAVQAGVATLCKDLSELPPTPTVRLTYWLVKASESKGGPPPPQALTPLLDTLAAKEGIDQFEIVGSAHVASLVDRHAESQAQVMKVGQRASLVRGTVVADVEIDAGREGRLETQLAVAPGEFAVAGEGNGVYYIVHAQPL